MPADLLSKVTGWIPRDTPRPPSRLATFLREGGCLVVYVSASFLHHHWKAREKGLSRLRERQGPHARRVGEAAGADGANERSADGL